MLGRVTLAFALAFATVAGGASCAGIGVRFVPPPPPVDDNSLGVGDVFAVRVFGEAELSQDYRVSQDGTIDFPYLGRVRVQGMEPTQVADTLRDRLREAAILRNPQVSVYVREYNSKRVSVIGQVQRPGTLNYEQNMTIVQAITGSGGFTALADQNSIRLTRRGRGGAPSQSYTIPVGMIAEGRVPNINLAPGDIIFVPERTF